LAGREQRDPNEQEKRAAHYNKDDEPRPQVKAGKVTVVVIWASLWNVRRHKEIARLRAR
jgi:hypothetical protein